MLLLTILAWWLVASIVTVATYSLLRWLYSRVTIAELDGPQPPYDGLPPGTLCADCWLVHPEGAECW